MAFLLLRSLQVHYALDAFKSDAKRWWLHFVDMERAITAPDHSVSNKLVQSLGI
jgi:hypothetical protein